MFRVTLTVGICCSVPRSQGVSRCAPARRRARRQAARRDVDRNMRADRCLEPISNYAGSRPIDVVVRNPHFGQCARGPCHRSPTSHAGHTGRRRGRPRWHSLRWCAARDRHGKRAPQPFGSQGRRCDGCRGGKLGVDLGVSTRGCFLHVLSVGVVTDFAAKERHVHGWRRLFSN